jgi:GTPase
MSDYSGFHAGFVAVMGRSTVGKSTLINALIGTKIAAVSPWPQTTRRRQLAILTLEKAQIIFVDTPGVHHPLHKLGEFMNVEAAGVLDECDQALFIVDVSQPPTEEDLLLVDLLHKLRRPVPVVLALNKSDLVDADTLEKHQEQFLSLFSAEKVISISATEDHNLQELIAILISGLPESPPFYPEDQLTDLYDREIVADFIREAVLYNLRAEIPHSIAVRIDSYKDQPNQITVISATLFVERDSQKGIVIGKDGEMIKKIGIEARQRIEALLDHRVFLELRVKVRKNWRNDRASLRSLGFNY